VRDPALASPLKLSFLSMQARPTTRCGQWPNDLGASDPTADWINRSYYNLGCATQQTLAAQIADPRDLVKPHALDPTDVQLRTRAIGALREGVDPGTQYNSTPPVIGPVGGF
jgi:pilus assembly protein CpaD